MKTLFYFLLGIWTAAEIRFGYGSLCDPSRDEQLAWQGLFWGALFIGAVFFFVFAIFIRVFGKRP